MYDIQTEFQSDFSPRPVGKEDQERLREELDGQGALLERRMVAIIDMYVRLQKMIGGKKDEILRPISAEATGYQDLDTAWEKMVEEKETLEMLPHVSKLRSENKWAYNEAYNTAYGVRLGQ